MANPTAPPPQPAKWKKIIGAVAPALATVLGTPMAGLAVKVIADHVLGLPEASEQEVEQAILKMAPGDLVKLKEAENDLLKHLADIGVKIEEISQKDRESARQREVQLKDAAPGILATLIVTGFGWVVYTLLVTEPPPGNREVLYMMLGTLSAALGQVLNYYFGSSSGSKAKTDALERVTTAKIPS